MASQDDAKKETFEEYQNKIKKYVDTFEKSARRHYLWLYSLSVVAILSSFFSGLSVASAWFSKDILAVLSSLPAAVLICSDRLKLEEKANWYWNMYYAYDALDRAISHEGLSEDAASKEETRIDKENGPKWPRFGSSPKKEGSSG